MTLGRAKACLSGVLLAGGGAVYIIVIIQTLVGRYDFGPGDWDSGIAWASPLILPILGFVIPSLSLVPASRDRVRIKHSYVFWLTLFLSFAYLACLVVVLWRVPLGIADIHSYVNRVMRTSLWAIGAFQAVLMGLLAKFYLEEVRDDIDDHGGVAKPAERP